MPVDPNGFLHAIWSGLEKVPAGLLAAALLAGPTLIWLIAQFMNPRAPRDRPHAPREYLEWMCQSCRSVNDDRLDRCYHCRAGRVYGIPIVVAPGGAPEPEIGIAVGPGLPAAQPTAEYWLALGGPSVGAAPGTVGSSAPGGSSVAPVATLAERIQSRPEDETAAVAAAPPRIVEPVRLEPKVKVSARRSPANTGSEGDTVGRSKPAAAAAARATRPPKVKKEDRAEPAEPGAMQRGDPDVATDRISVELGRLLRGGIALVVEAPPTDIYVQFIDVAEPTTGEIVAEAKLGELTAHRIGPTMRSQLAALGWIPLADPTSGAGGWTRTWRESDWDPAEVARLVVQTFEAYGVEPSSLRTYSGVGVLTG